MLVLALALAPAGQAAPAHAQSSIAFGFGVDTSSRSAQLVSADLAVSGDVTVEFSGDRAAGCESAGNCDVAGVVSWNPPRTGSLTVERDKRRGRELISGSVDFDTFSDDAPGTLAAVHRGNATCSDAVAGSGSLAIPETRGSRFGLSLAGPDSDVLDTRCPGPLADDLEAALPRLSLPISAIRRGRVLDLSAVRPFAAHGLQGTVHSSLRLRVTDVQRAGGNGRDFAGLGIPLRHRLRIVTASYRINEVEGRLPVAFAGASDPGSCAPLDSCGTSGTMLLEPRADDGVLTVTAIARARRPKRDLLAALGRGRGNPRGIQVGGVGTWDGPGTVATSDRRGCHDSAALTTGLIDVARGRRGMAIRYRALDGSGGPRSRCTAPLLGGTEPTVLAAGTAPLSAFRAPIGAMTLRTGRSLDLDGYTVMTQPDVTVGIERLHVRSSTFRVP